MYTISNGLKMLSARGIRNACPRSNVSFNALLRRDVGHESGTKLSCPQLRRQAPRSGYLLLRKQPFSTTRHTFEDEKPFGSVSKSKLEELENTVRDAKQRFRDTLPKDYLNEEEYALYVRLYGPPLRETAPEDVGIDTHADMNEPPPKAPNEGTLLRELEGGKFEEITYEVPPREEEIIEEIEEVAISGDNGEGGHASIEELLRQTELEARERDVAQLDAEEELSPEELAEMEQAELEAEGFEVEELEAESYEEEYPATQFQDTMEKRPNYIEAVARNQREADALQRLAADFERTMEKQKEAEDRAAAAKKEGKGGEVLESKEALSWPEEWELEPPDEQFTSEQLQRYHPYTLAGSFHGNSFEVVLPTRELVAPISDILKRTHIDHVREAAESNFGGAGLPLSPETLAGQRNGNMGGVGLLANQRQMSEIEADAFMAGFVPGAYASSSAVLREVRKRLGTDWLQSRLKNGGEGLSFLDTGTGGAGLSAWEQILRAEWDMLKEKGEVTGSKPPGRKTVVAASDRLRGRLKSIYQDTTFLPRLPDYEHSGEMRGPRLEGGDRELPRKSYNVIIASHMLLRERDSHRRQAVLNNLWQLLDKDGGVLIIVEKGHPRGFEAVAHARKTVLDRFLLQQSGEPSIAAEDFNPAYHREAEPGQIIAPCTTQGTCPMYVRPGQASGRKDFCHFSQRFIRPSFTTKLLRKHADNHGEVLFSYVAIQRGISRPSSPSATELTEMAKKGYEHLEVKPDMQTLPRLMMPPLKARGHVTMDVCTPEGKIERWTVPKSFSKLAYHDARKARWGDLWALGAKSRTERNPRQGKTKEISKRESISKKKARKGGLGDAGDLDELDMGGKKRGTRQRERKEMMEEFQRAEEEEMSELDEEIGDEVEAEIEKEDRAGRERR